MSSTPDPTAQPEDVHPEDQTPSVGQISEGPNSFSSDETDLGGADAVTDKTTSFGKSNPEQ